MDNVNTLTFGILRDIILPILIALVTSVLAIRRYRSQARIDLQKEFDSRFNEKKWEVYLDYIELIRGMFYREQNLEANSIKLSDEEIMPLASQILLIGSDDVVKAFQHWQKLRKTKGLDHKATVEVLFAVIMEMRKDLGYRLSQLEFEEMLGVIAPDDK